MNRRHLTLLCIALATNACSPSVKTPVPNTPVATTSPQVSKEYREEASEAIDALRAMQSVVKASVSYEDYPRRLQDCRIVVDKFLGKHKSEEISGMNSAISLAMGDYQQALEVWQAAKGDLDNGLVSDHQVLQGDPSLVQDAIKLGAQYTGSTGTYIRPKELNVVLWDRATQQIAKAEGLLAQ